MADLFDRIYQDNPDNETPKLNTHGLTATLNLVLRGIFTATQAKNFWTMDTAASTDFDALIANISAEPDTEKKYQRLANLEAAGVAVEVGAITTKAVYKNAAGISS